MADKSDETVESTPTELVDVEITADMEAELSQMGKGEEDDS